MKRILFLAITLLALTTKIVAAEGAALKISPYEFKAADGTKVRAELGELAVPESRSRDDSRTITLRFVRFPSTAKNNAGSPIVYLAGGPGGSGIAAARGTRLPLFMALREFADVIALDQRGTGMSGGNDLACDEPFAIPFDRPLDPVQAGRILADAMGRCAARLRRAGIDPAAYNTRESANDLEDLRVALGAKKLTLWGISYGTHLALATLKDHGTSVERVILAGLEPLDGTLKLPTDQQELMERIAALAVQDPAVHRALPDLVGSVQKLLAKLAEEPQTVVLTHPLNGMSAPVTVGRSDLQSALAGMLEGPATFAAMPDFIARLEQGDWTALALASGGRRIGKAPSMMSVAMDCASGASAERTRRIAKEAGSTLLGDAINLPWPGICEGLDVPDLGDAFRAPFSSDVPALLISGTLDGRTSVRNGEAVARQMKSAQHLVIEGAGHSDPLFLSSPKILAAMKTFLRGKKVRDLRIALDQPVHFIVPRPVVTVAPETLKRYVGTYRLAEGDTRRVVMAGTILYTLRNQGEPFPLRPQSETDFFYENMDAGARFVVDESGKVTGMFTRQSRDAKEVWAEKVE